MKASALALGFAAVGLAWVLATSGCGASLSEEQEEDLEEILDGGLDAEALTTIPVCGDMTVAELATEDTISDSCRDVIDSYLPDEQTSYEDVIVTLGSDTAADGSLLLYLQGADASGNALSASAFASATVAVTVGGEATVLAEGEFTVSLVADVPTDLISLGVVNDYSGSMLVQDLQTVAEIETDVFT